MSVVPVAEPVGELPAGEVRGHGAGVDDLDELVRRGAGDAGHELVDADERLAARGDAGDDRVASRVVGDRDRSRRARRARQTVQIVELRQSCAGIALRPGGTLRAGRALSPGWTLRTGWALRSGRPLCACRALGSLRAGRALRSGEASLALRPGRAGVALRPLRPGGACRSDRALDVPRDRQLALRALRRVGNHAEQAGDLLPARLDHGAVGGAGRAQRGQRACARQHGDGRAEHEQPGTGDTENLGHERSFRLGFQW